jgi:hypothetical protein
MGIEREINEILNEAEANDLALALTQRIRQLTPPTLEERDSLGRILEDVSQELPYREALWMAFWLGSAWQDFKD